MLNIYTVSFFGHRYVENSEEIEIRLGKLLRELITLKSSLNF